MLLLSFMLCPSSVNTSGTGNLQLIRNWSGAVPLCAVLTSVAKALRPSGRHCAWAEAPAAALLGAKAALMGARQPRALVAAAAGIGVGSAQAPVRSAWPELRQHAEAILRRAICAGPTAIARCDDARLYGDVWIALIG